MNFFDIHKMPNKGIPLAIQRKLWLRNFMQAFFVVFFVYMAMYLIRNNFKAAQPLLKEEIGLSTLELGYIGLAFSITYGLGKTLLGYFVDGRNTKRIISFLLILSAIIVLIMGFVLSYFGSVMGLLIVLWGLNGIFQSVGGPASYSTISRWAPRTKRGRYLGFWNTSHNIGGAIAGGVALWGANTFFHGNVVGMFIFPSVIALIIGIVTLFIGKDDPEELGWNRAEEIWEEPIDQENIDSQGMTKWDIFKKYILGNPVIWILCISNVFVYIVRIGIDNWAPLYVSEHLHFNKGDAVNTIFYFEIGALVASLLWGYISDLLKGRSLIYSSSLPSYHLYFIQVSLQHVIEDTYRREKLNALSEYFNHQFMELFPDQPLSNTPIKNIVCDSLASAQAQYDMLFEHGIFVSYLRYPTVSQPTLRISLSYFHDTDDIDRLFNVMKQYDEGDSYV